LHPATYKHMEGASMVDSTPAVTKATREADGGSHV
jgi:hypothetical protein